MKERVIGASVLVGLAVWLIPWVLDGPVPDAAPGAAQAPAAERSAPLRTRTIRLEDRQGPAAPGGAPDIPGTPAPRDSDGAAGVPPEVSAGRPAAPETPVPLRAAAGAQPDAPSGGSAAAPAGVPRETGNAPGAASPGAGSSPLSPVEPGPGWLVQVGSFSDEENARRQADRLADMGYEARLYPHRSGGELVYRVRVGPEVSRESADEVVSYLRDRGFQPHAVSGD